MMAAGRLMIARQLQLALEFEAAGRIFQ